MLKMQKYRKTKQKKKSITLCDDLLRNFNLTFLSQTVLLTIIYTQLHTICLIHILKKKKVENRYATMCVLSDINFKH